ncbi:hypothetical protein [Streptomyces silvisoli]|uniref:hypothetical protein n=1 Tax=Streptomyces silvisoli TaxID=3034235 RepID=UPI003703ABE3
MLALASLTMAQELRCGPVWEAGHILSWIAFTVWLAVGAGALRRSGITPTRPEPRRPPPNSRLPTPVHAPSWRVRRRNPRGRCGRRLTLWRPAEQDVSWFPVPVMAWLQCRDPAESTATESRSS